MNDIYLQLYLQNHINVHIYLYLYLYGFVSVNALGEIIYTQVKCKCKRLATVNQHPTSAPWRMDDNGQETVYCWVPVP
jgi:hypothetical protein